MLQGRGSTKSDFASLHACSYPVEILRLLSGIVFLARLCSKLGFCVGCSGFRMFQDVEVVVRGFTVQGFPLLPWSLGPESCIFRIAGGSEVWILGCRLQGSGLRVSFGAGRCISRWVCFYSLNGRKAKHLPDMSNVNLRAVRLQALIWRGFVERISRFPACYAKSATRSAT